jgi:hypothetical protein
MIMIFDADGNEIENAKLVENVKISRVYAANTETNQIIPTALIQISGFDPVNESSALFAGVLGPDSLVDIYNQLNEF